MYADVICTGCRRRFRVLGRRPGESYQCKACAGAVAERPLPPERPADPPRPPRRPLRSEEPAYGHDRMKNAERDIRTRPKDHGMPFYLWLLAVAPWGIPVLTRGGCIWVCLAALLCGAGFAIARAHRTPVFVRLIGLLTLNGLAYAGVIG